MLLLHDERRCLFERRENLIFTLILILMAYKVLAIIKRAATQNYLRISHDASFSHNLQCAFIKKSDIYYRACS